MHNFGARFVTESALVTRVIHAWLKGYLNSEVHLYVPALQIKGGGL